MPNLPISGLPASSTLQGDELFADVQGGVTKYTTLEDIATYTTYIQGNSYGLYNQTGSSNPISGSIDSVATSGSLLNGGVGTLTVPANSFSAGDAYHARIAGKITISNNHNLEFHFDSSATTLIDVGPITMAGATNKNWSLEITFVVQATGSAGVASIISSGELQSRTDSANDVVTEIFSFTNNTTFDTTVSNTLSVEGILGASCGPSENIFSELFILNKIY